MPERMCLCCRKKGSKEDFFRISTIKEKCVLDIEHRIQARGIYVCKDKQCVEKLSKHKKIKVDIEILLKMLSILDKSEKSIEKILIGMRNSEYFIYGVDDNIEGVKRDKVKLIILPKDVKEKYKEDFTIGEDGIPVCKAGTKMNHDGVEISKARIKFRCPLASRGVSQSSMPEFRWHDQSEFREII